jgi:hypothetical protein
VVYHLVAGQPPFAGAGLSELLAGLAGEGPRPLATLVPEAPPALLALVTRAMSRCPDERHATVAQLADELEMFLVDRDR